MDWQLVSAFAIGFSTGVVTTLLECLADYWGERRLLRTSYLWH